MIWVDSLTYYYGAKMILEDITGHFRNGSFTAVMGENGSGKTTLIRLLAGITASSRGKVIIEGRDIKHVSLEERARVIGYLSQTAVIPESSRVWDTVLAGRKPYFGWKPRKEDEELVGELFSVLDLWDFADRKVETLSGGEFQKVRILRLFAQDTPVLFLDEPMNNLDMRFQYRLFKYLKTLCRDKQRTVVAVLHDLNMAIPYADSFLCLKKGRVAAWGKIEYEVDEHIISDIFGISCRFIHDEDRLFVRIDP